MTDIPKCPKSNSEYTYFDGMLYVCPIVPMSSVQMTQQKRLPIGQRTATVPCCSTAMQ